MLGISCGLGASFSSVAEEAASSVAADDKTRLPREEEAVNGRLPLKAKALAKFCPQSNIIREVVENFIGGFFLFQAVVLQLIFVGNACNTSIWISEIDILCYQFGVR